MVSLSLKVSNHPERGAIWRSRFICGPSILLIKRARTEFSLKLPSFPLQSQREHSYLKLCHSKSLRRSSAKERAKMT